MVQSRVDAKKCLAAVNEGGTSMSVVFDSSTDANSADRDFIAKSLQADNRDFAGEPASQDLCVYARDQGAIIAGLVGYTHWNWLYVRLLWVSDEYRKQGIGRALLSRAEKLAAERGCEHSSLDTFSESAQRFYESCGYAVFGVLDDYPKGCQRRYLAKRDLNR